MMDEFDRVILAGQQRVFLGLVKSIAAIHSEFALSKAQMEADRQRLAYLHSVAEFQARLYRERMGVA